MLLYLFLIASIGRLEAIRFTGRKLAINATNMLTAKRSISCLIPKLKIVIRIPTSIRIS